MLLRTIRAFPQVSREPTFEIKTVKEVDRKDTKFIEWGTIDSLQIMKHRFTKSITSMTYTVKKILYKNKKS